LWVTSIPTDCFFVMLLDLVWRLRPRPNEVDLLARSMAGVLRSGAAQRPGEGRRRKLLTGFRQASEQRFELKAVGRTCNAFD
jgi:hypothetical protein